jgi:predicted nucleic acid-binding OB-fold protein
MQLYGMRDMVSSRGPAADESDLYEGETHVHLLDASPRNQPGGTCHGLTEKGLHLVRIRLSSANSGDELGARFELDPENVLLLGALRHRDLSPRGVTQLADSITGIIREKPTVYLGFYNRAGSVSLKMHAFQLLPGIGQSKATRMVKARGRVGWENLDAVSAGCEIDAAAALGARLAEEMQDPTSKPSLLELLVRAA